MQKRNGGKSGSTRDARRTTCITRNVQFGEWLRRDLEAGIVEPALVDHDLAILPGEPLAAFIGYVRRTVESMLSTSPQMPRTLPACGRDRRGSSAFATLSHAHAVEPEACPATRRIIRTRSCDVHRQPVVPAKAAFSAASSSLIICIIAAATRVALTVSRSDIIGISASGTICHETP